jgi:hypothetical protein
MDERTRAFVEIRKTLLELQITALDAQATIQALKQTVLEVGGAEAGLKLANHQAVEKHKLAAKRADLQSEVDALQTILEKSPSPSGRVH